VLECNPRATSGLHLFSADADLPAALVGEGPLREPINARPRMIAALMSSAGLASAAAKGSLPQWQRDWKRADDVVSVPGDRSPLGGALADLGSYAALALRQQCNLREAATRDIEWDGEPMPVVDA